MLKRKRRPENPIIDPSDLIKLLEEAHRTFIVNGKEVKASSKTYEDVNGKKITIGGLFRNVETGEVLLESPEGKTESLGIVPMAKFYAFPEVL